MFTVNPKVLPEALEYVLGKKNVCDAPKDEDLFKVLCAAGVAKMEKGEIKVFNSKNMLESANSVFLTPEQVTMWRNLDFTMQFQLRGRKARLNVIIEKLPGDNHATVADSHGNHIFGAVCAVQDTRSPWLLFDGDKRPFSLQFTNKRTPNDFGVCSICTGWSKSKDSMNGKSSYVYSGEYEIWSCTKIVRKILADYMGHEFEHLNADLNNTERAKFLRAGEGVYFQDLGDKVLEISKNSGETSGQILFGTVAIGTLCIDPVPKSFGVYSGQIKFNEDLDENVPRVQVENAIWQMICPNERTVFATPGTEDFGVKVQISKKGKKGKKQYAMA